MENSYEIKTLILNFEQQINVWNDEHPNLEFVFNQELYKINYAKVKYIVSRRQSRRKRTRASKVLGWSVGILL